jgi:two-component system response regulator YesN
MEQALTVLIVDDESVARKGIKKMIRSLNHPIKIIGEAANGKEGLEAAVALQPDIIITDIKMSLSDGLKLREIWREANLDAKIIVLSAYEEFEYAQLAINFGVSDYILKPVNEAKLIESVLRIGTMIREEKIKQQYLDKLKQELPAIKKQFILDLLSGGLRDSGEIRSKLDFLEIPLTFKNQIVLVIKFDEIKLLFRRLGQEQQEKIRIWFVELATWVILLQGNFQGVVFGKSLEEIIIILQMARFDADILATLKGSCNHLIAKIKTTMKIIRTVSIGISSLSYDLAGIHEAYQEALTACNNVFVPGSGTVTCINDDGARRCHATVRAAVLYIKNHYDQGVTVETAARELYVSPSHLMHLFKAELGKTFNECLIDCRIEKAKELLKDKKYKIYEVCEQVGYTDTRYFSQLFKRITGLSPREYIKHVS